ncbi:MAG: malectin domain-containing carbohydrate-binding protein [Candidatus Velthaea sp.]
MFDHGHTLRRFWAVLVAAALVSACSGSHSGGQSSLPPVPVAKAHAAAAAAGTDVVALDAGGSAAGTFSADTDYGASGTWTYKSTSTIDTSSVANPAPQAVYQTEREGKAISYSIPGLTAGAAYTVRLSFAELWWSAAGQRVFNIAINGSNALSNFDVFAAAGARNKAVSESFTASANSAGVILITFNAVTDNAAINAIEIVSGGSTPTPTPAPTATGTAGPGTTLAIDAGGAAAGNFAADEDVVAAGTWTYVVANPIDTSGVANPAPQAVYQSEREGKTISYSIPGLTAGAPYTVRLDFAELWWTAAGQRVFNVSINATKVLSNFDVYATAGARFKAVAQTFSATANASGTITIALTSVTDNAAINGIEISGGGSATPTPTPTTAAFNDYPSFGYDVQHDVFNPNSTALAPAGIPKLHLAWQASLGDYNTQTQPVLATEISGHAGVVFVGGGTGNVYGYDALKGTLLWKTSLGQELYTACGGTSYFGVGGTVAYDAATKSLYVIGNSNPAADTYAANTLYRLDGTTGSILGRVNFAPAAAAASELNFSHTAVALNNGIAYVGTSSSCDISPWRGSVVAVSVPGMTVANRFFTVWDPQNTRGAGMQPWSGAGVWGWGGVSVDFSGNVLTGVGNADNGTTPYGAIVAPFAAAPTEYSGYAETLLELSSSLGSVVAANHPIPTGTYSQTVSDLDLQGTPLVFQPNGTGCAPMVAIQGKSGDLSLYNEATIGNGPVVQYQMSPPGFDDSYLGDPAFSPITGLIYAPVATSASPTLIPAGLVAINPGCGTPSVTWHAAFGSDSSSIGTPRSVPAVSAGGVVFAGTVNGTGGDLWAIDASTGAVLNGGNPLLPTSANLRMPATIDGNWVFVLDNSGNMYGLTTDPSYPTIQAIYRAPDARARKQADWYRRRRITM